MCLGVGNGTKNTFDELSVGELLTEGLDPAEPEGCSGERCSFRITDYISRVDGMARSDIIRGRIAVVYSLTGYQCRNGRAASILDGDGGESRVRIGVGGSDGGCRWLLRVDILDRVDFDGTVKDITDLNASDSGLDKC